jgi:hypothetical protein
VPDIGLPGISIAAVAKFCDAIAFAEAGREPTQEERKTLSAALMEFSQEAHSAGIQPERMLIGLKKAWTSICRRALEPDMFDALWLAVVDIALNAYESARVAQ